MQNISTVLNAVINGDCHRILQEIPDNSVDSVQVRPMFGNWQFFNESFAEIIPLAAEDDIIYCDPPYFGRHTDYYNGWTEKDEENLFLLLSETRAKFVLSTWHHNYWRENDMMKKYWDKFNVLTKDHFYHNGGNMENRREVVEALVCNFDVNGFARHNHGVKETSKCLQLELEM